MKVKEEEIKSMEENLADLPAADGKAEETKGGGPKTNLEVESFSWSVTNTSTHESGVR